MHKQNCELDFTGQDIYAGENERTPDISDIITEITSLDGWASGNNMMIIVTTGDTTDVADKNREMEATDGDPAGAPVLNVTLLEAEEPDLIQSLLHFPA